MELKADTDYYDVHETIVINDVIFYGIKHVKGCYNIEFDGWKIETHSGDCDIDCAYLVIDTVFDAAFAHWIFESASYIQFYHILKRRYPTLKIIMNTNLSYKHHMYDYFGVKSSDIVRSIETPNNICFVPQQNTSFNDKTITDKYINHIKSFWNIFQTSIIEKTIDIVLLPRQKKENYKGNERITDTADIEEKLSTITNNYCVLHTDNNKEIKSQIDIIRRAKTIIVTDGSPYLVNGFFAKDSKIILLGDITAFHAQDYIKYAFFNRFIASNNHVIRLPYSASGGEYGNCHFKLEHIRQYL